jgi:predicted phage terminase large subunit-like protein
MNSTLEAVLRQNFLSFARKAIRELEGTTLSDDQYLRYLARELDLFAEGETRRLIINLPPGHLKTWLASVCLPAWMLAHDPWRKIIVVTHAEHLSKTIARNIRSILQSGWFKEIFPPRIKKGHAEVMDFGTTAGGGVFVTSFRGGFTGRRADVIVVDDPHDIGHTHEEIESTIEAFDTALLSRLNDRQNGRVLVVAHRVHERDLSAHLLQKKGKWRHVLLPLVATRDQTYKTSTADWLRRKGEVLRPDAFDAEVIDELRENSFNPGFDMLYQQDANFQALPAIEADHFGNFSGPAPIGPILLSVDPGVTNRRTSAFSVIQAWCLADNRYYLLDQFREQIDFVDLRDELRHFRRVYRPIAILVERAANGHALISELTRKFAKLLVPIEPNGRSKSARLRVHADTIVAKRIWLPTQATWREGFVKEFIEFPRGKFTDQVDATTQFLDYADDFADLEPTPQAGLAAFVNRAGQTRSISSFNARHDHVRAVAVRGNGQPISGAQRNLPILTVKGKIIF